jgi:transposase
MVPPRRSPIESQSDGVIERSQALACSSIIEGTTMEQYAGIDVSLESASVCVVDSTGRIMREAKVVCEPEALIAWFTKLGVSMARIGLEAGPLSQWLYARMREAGLSVELLETRHVRDAFKAMPVKTDRRDARGIAQLMRLGWFRPVHCKSLPAQELRAILTARKLVQNKRHDLEMSLRGILRGFGLKVGQTTPRNFETRVRELADGQPTLLVVADAMLLARAVLVEQLGKLQKRLVSLARQDTRARLLMSTPGVGVLVALTYVAAIDDPARFRSSKAVGAHFGLTPKKYQSGETDVTGRISKIGDASVRTALYEAANVILTRPVRGSLLKSWAMRVAKRTGMRKAKVALARKLAVILHRMLANGSAFVAGKAAAKA